jgi:hypothetical protein
MSSDRPRFVLSRLTCADPPGHYRLHSRVFAVFTRVGSLLLLLSIVPLLRSDSLVEASIHVTLVLALAWLLWSRSKSVVATNDGLAVGVGKSTRLIPWSRVLDVRELPWIRFSPPWYPRMWQVDLDSDERFDFCGVRRTREIVLEFVKRSEAHPDRTSSASDRP